MDNVMLNNFSNISASIFNDDFASLSSTPHFLPTPKLGLTQLSISFQGSQRIARVHHKLMKLHSSCSAIH